MQTRFLGGACLLAVWAAALSQAPASAAILASNPPPNVTLSFLTDGTTIGSVDVRGTALLSDALFNGAYLSDLGSPSSPNQSLFALNLGFSESLFVSFSEASLALSPDLLSASLTGTAVQLSPTVTDPVLLQMLAGGGVGQYGFSFTTLQDIGGGFSIASYDLIGVVTSDQVPEPSSVALTGIGLGFAAVGRRRGWFQRGGLHSDLRRTLPNERGSQADALQVEGPQGR
jgi:hypothetical protein